MMIVGLGVDIVEIERVRQAADDHGGKFLERVFTPQEIEYCERKANPYSHYALRFAAKEAFIKAIGISVGLMGLRDIAIVNRQDGSPEIQLSGSAALWKKKKSIQNVWFSGSHSRNFAVAMVILEVDKQS